MTKVSFSVKSRAASENLDKGIFILEELKEGKALDVVSEYIIDQIRDKAGSPTIQWVSLDKWNYNHKTHEGKFRLYFNIVRTFYCSDIESAQRDYIDIEFSYNNSLINGSGRYCSWEVND